MPIRVLPKQHVHTGNKVDILHIHAVASALWSFSTASDGSHDAACVNTVTTIRAVRHALHQRSQPCSSFWSLTQVDIYCKDAFARQWAFLCAFSPASWQCEPTIRGKVGALASEGMSDTADRLAALTELAHIPHTDTVVTASCGKQVLLA